MGPESNTKIKSLQKASSLVCKWPFKEEVNWRQINIYPELLKRQEGKGTLCICILGGGCHRRFYWATLTLVPANPGIKADKSRSPASLVWTLQENQEP